MRGVMGNLEDFKKFVESHLDNIRSQFVDPDNVKIGIVLWHVGMPDDGFVLTNSTIEETTKALLRLMKTGDPFDSKAGLIQ
jgi:hypothetical protein